MQRNMAVTYNNPRFLWSIFLSVCYFFAKSESTSDVYIVYLGQNHIRDEKLTSESHLNLLLNVLSSEEEARQSMLYSYRYSFSGFAAKLDATQVNTLAEMEGVVSVFRSRILEVHTSRSWDFMGLTLNNNDVTSPMQLAYGDDVIVGVLDTGIWPESESFKESPVMGAIPSSWKGACDQGETVIPPITCNRKLIGARYYYTGYEQTVQPIDPSFEYKSPRDRIGHGTHTASTAVGAVVRNASFYGIGQGTACGGAPRARLAVYKTCWNLTNSGSCCEADILAAFDQALKDGVHIISASFGAAPPLGVFFKSSTDIGSFHAMQAGVTVVFAGGNDDSLNPSMVQNVNPWSISVAASSFDRTYPTEMALSATEENFTIVGESLSTTEVNGFLVAATTHFVDGICDRRLNRDYSKKANRRVILCFSSMGPTSIGTAIDAVQNASGKGMIFVEALGRQIPEVEVVPTVRVDLQQGTRLRQYIGTTFNRPRIRITPNKGVIGRSPAPEVAYFSSRGPSSLSPDILKPDVTAPGVNVLAAWPSNLSPSLSDSDDRRTNWNLQSGTSMACPHVTGVVALLKSVHPTWSPAAIKSALMTTAYNKDTACDGILSGGTTKTSDPFDVGAGHINPIKAMDPGLVYDMKTTDYIIFLCNMGYSQKNIRLIVLNGTTTTTCPNPSIFTSNLNYPAITVSNLQSTTTLKRTVRNVGQNRNAAYFPRIVNPEGVDVYVWPRVLVFSWMKCEITYYVTLSPRKISQGRYDFGEIVWSDGFHSVRSPIIVRVNNTAVAFGTATTSKLSSYYGTRIAKIPL